jgi:hypothetical protein
MKSAKYWAEKLNMQQHPEGGFFKEVYRSAEPISVAALPDRFSGMRVFSTAIYYLLADDDFSAFHRIKSDETWHFYQGTGLELYEIDQKGNLIRTVLGPNPEEGMALQYTVLAGNWFASRVLHRSGFALMGCTVAPGFDFEDFEMADASKLKADFPQYQTIIEELTR